MWGEPTQAVIRATSVRIQNLAFAVEPAVQVALIPGVDGGVVVITALM